jgi:hypothetical protein
MQNEEVLETKVEYTPPFNFTLRSAEELLRPTLHIPFEFYHQRETHLALPLIAVSFANPELYEKIISRQSIFDREDEPLGNLFGEKND